MRLRRSVLLAFGFSLLASAPATAQTAVPPPPSPAEKSIIAGSYTCNQKVPCNNLGAFSPEQWATAGDACIRKAFGLSSPSGLIDDVAGIDADGNLTTRVENVPKRAGPLLIPQCAVREKSHDNCAIHCTLVKQ